MVRPVEASPPPVARAAENSADLQSVSVVELGDEPQFIARDPYKFLDVLSQTDKLVSWRIFWYVVPRLAYFIYRTIDSASSAWRRITGQPSEKCLKVDAAHPTCAGHSFTPSGGIEAEYWSFIPVRSAGQLERAAELVLQHLRNWRSFYRRSHVEFLGPEPDPSANDPVLFKFAPLAPWGNKYTGREFTTVTVSFNPRELLPDGSGWILRGRLIDGYDHSGQRLPHDFTGPVQTEVRIINEPGRSGIEVRDIWVDVKNQRQFPDYVAAKSHLYRSADGFAGLRKTVLKELKNLCR